MQSKEQLQIIEALLFASPDPLTQKRMNLIFETDVPDLEEMVGELNKAYESQERTFFIEAVSGGFQLISKPEYEMWIRRLIAKSGKLILSTAALDTLAIIAYKQPVGRYEIEAIRGVDSSGVIKTLLNRNMVKIQGRDSGPGRPLLYQTTPEFLEHFGLNRLSDLPKLKEISELLEADPSLGEQMAVFEDLSMSASEAAQS
ncbi:MAG: SMC-Scp complex subunit ScpB [Candidatus Marinimicrobia bacterium]|jgi:segregation and condensation protein B|nr:SMC-Scp complex subunit ScpB [Candidatus Neomarinimicrobiota bacterium]MBT3496362.1 SMC-Scp complex subunit ScpB [Candidatus Neomarinimicrobiota bacterium]MBT3692573.1 SMC-Scp complex subunit ScpB [Candidatus Neomarinimicrobiota bacterium]MBT3731992.1 SMC-Scp complex subunit ScpB [Candidatus Neomarinimicrobiota bacterium]MBT4145211.1 SMC-Scp complex subunit ScpB [Candidatus Neomarinimicrobiota bacterium]